MILDQSEALAASRRILSLLPVRNCGDPAEPRNWAERDRTLSPAEIEILNDIEEPTQ